jgi:hypothetical protein
MPFRRAAAMLACCTALAGCTESALVRSYPPGSKLYVNGDFVGVTPVVYSVADAKFTGREFPVRIERTGYAPADGVLRKQTCPGRVAGGVFTLGILFLFRSATCFVSPQDFLLEPLSTAADAGAGAAHQPTVEERLDRIRRMRDQGVITDEEFEHYRTEILKGL